MREISLLLDLIKASIHQKDKLRFDAACDSEILEKMIKRQQLVSLVWPLMAIQEDGEWKELAEHLESAYNQSLHKSLIQQIEVQSLLDSMEEKGMDCLPLKGWIMRDYYAEQTFRSMTDFDVLLREFHEKEIQQWMEGMGYEAKNLQDNHHDVYIKRPFIVVELHKSLSSEMVVKEMPQIDRWLKDVWKLCSPIDGKLHIYKMKDEDFYIYHLIHMCKHLRFEGLGIRPLIDIYVFLEKMESQMDWKYIDSVLKELNLVQFEEVMRTLSKKCFSEEEIVLNKEEMLLLEFMLKGSLFGDKKTGAAIMVAKEKNKPYFLKRILTVFRAVFRSSDILKGRYPILERFPIVLPVVWIIRAFRIIFKERHKISTLKEGSKQMEYDQMKQIFKAAGMDW